MKARNRWVFFTLMLAWGAAWVLAFQKQVLRESAYRASSLSNIIRKIPLLPPRGRILDRHGRVLAGYQAGILFISLGSRIHNLPFPVYTPTQIRYIPQSRALRLDEVPGYFEQLYHHPDILPMLFPLRTYPAGPLTAHVVGYVGEASRYEVEQGKRWGILVGKSALERALDDRLTGSPGTRFFLVNAAGELQTLDPLPPRPPEPGGVVVTSLDLDLQRAVDSLFLPHERGAVVMLDVRTGEILVLYSRPSFDPDELTGLRAKTAWQRLVNDPASPLLNRAVAGLYPPGSTWKPFVALLALDRGWVNPAARPVFCDGTYRFGSRVWKCWDPAGHGALNLVEAIEQSCDVYFYDLARKIGLRPFLEMITPLRDLLHRTYGVLPEEKPGLVPDWAWYTRRYGRNVSEGMVLNLGIGQGEILLTPLQMAILAGLIATEGRLPMPHLLRDAPVQDTLYLEASRRAYRLVREGMERVVQGEHGTASGSRIPGLIYAGKTGTAENPHGKEHSLFIAYAPAQNPRIAVSVIVEEGGHGSERAAPIARALIERYAKLYGMGGNAAP